MTTCIVVRSILLSADQQLGMEELVVVARPDFVDGRRVEVHEDGSRNMLAAAGFREEGLERAWVANILCVRVGPTIEAKAMLEEVTII